MEEFFCERFGEEAPQEETFRGEGGRDGRGRSHGKRGCREEPSLTSSHGEDRQVKGTAALFSLGARGLGCCSPTSVSQEKVGQNSPCSPGGGTPMFRAALSC